MDRETLALGRYGKPYTELCGSCKRAIDMALAAFYSGGPKVATIGDVSVRADGESFVLDRPTVLSRAELEQRLKIIEQQLSAMPGQRDQQMARIEAQYKEQTARLAQERQAIAEALAG